MDAINQSCAMQHIITFHKQAMKNKKADFSEPCQTCRYAKECKFDWFVKISNALPMSYEKINLAHQEHL